MGKGFLPAALASAALLGALVPSASAETTQKRGVRVVVDGALSPTELPRRGTAPVSVEVSGEIEALQTSALPQLNALTVAINRAGILDLRGIPRCRIGHINPSTTLQAETLCGDALIGSGHFSANVVLPEQSPFPSNGKLLAFNGTIGRKPAIFAHVYGTEPLATSYVFAFRVTRERGTFGTLLSASFPKATGDWGYITGISLKLNRRFLRAGCPAPTGFSRVFFPLARTSFEFDGGLEIESTMTRSCKARG